MSAIVRAILLRKLLDHTCVEDALKEMGVIYTKTGEVIKVSNSTINIHLSKKGAEIKYRTREELQTQDVNSFIENLTLTYTKKLEEKIARLKMEEARLNEDESLELYAEEERKKRERDLRKERMRLESIKRREEAALKVKIGKKVEALKVRAKKLGLFLKQEQKGKERVLVFVRR